MMGHGLRQQKLASMGVAQWYARVRLPGAAESVRFMVAQAAPVSAAAVPSSAVGLSSESGASSVPSADTARHLLQEVSEPVSESRGGVELLAGLSPAEGGGQVAAPSVEAGAVHQVALSASLYTCGAWLIASLEARGAWVPQEQALLTNILRACGAPYESLEFHGEFEWPVFSSPKLPSGQVTYLQACFKEWVSAVSKGEPGRSLMFGSTDELDLLDNVVQGSDAAIRVDVSLASMLSMPVRKAQVWRALQPHLALLRT